MFFKKKSPPQGHRDDSAVALESSICTGETIIGFKNEHGKLEQAVVVRCQEDIDEFYVQHDLKNSGRIRWKKGGGTMKYILFDLDGTLTDSKEGITKCAQYALKKFGIEKSPDELTCFIGPPLKEQFASYAEIGDDNAEKAVEYYRERFAPIGIFENRAYDGVLNMLARLKEAGKTIALATNKPQIFAERIVEKYGIAPYLDLIVGSGLHGGRENKTEVIADAMKILSAPENETVMVGDRIQDEIGARNNSIAFVGALYGYGDGDELKNADFLAADVKELTELLIRL